MSTMTPPLPVQATAPVAAPTPVPPVTPYIVVNGDVRVPVHDLATFREWACSDARPEKGRFAYLAGTLWIDLSMEQGYSHNDVKAEIDGVLRALIRQTQTGRTFADGMLLTVPPTDFSTVPDGMFVLFTTLQAGRVTQIPNRNQVGVVELEGVPDMVLEVVSDSSVEKDTVRLPGLYHAAGIPEFWLVDARGDLRFEIYRCTGGGYVPTRQPDGWWRSDVFGRDFLLTAAPDLMGQPWFALQHRP